MTTLPCPFAACEAQLTAIREMRYPGPSAGAVVRIPMHDIVGPNSWYGRCPGSLMTEPGDDAQRRTLREAAKRLSEARLPRSDGEPDPVTGTARPPHSRSPRPDPAPRWFRDSSAPNQQEQHERQRALGVADELAARREGPGFLDRARETINRSALQAMKQGGAVTSVADVKASIDEAVSIIHEAQSAQAVLQVKIGESLAKISYIQQASQDPLGMPVLAALGEDTDAIGTSLAVVIETLEQYKATL